MYGPTQEILSKPDILPLREVRDIPEAARALLKEEK